MPIDLETERKLRFLNSAIMEQAGFLGQQIREIRALHEQNKALTERIDALSRRLTEHEDDGAVHGRRFSSIDERRADAFMRSMALQELVLRAQGASINSSAETCTPVMVEDMAPPIVAADRITVTYTSADGSQQKITYAPINEESL